MNEPIEEETISGGVSAAPRVLPDSARVALVRSMAGTGKELRLPTTGFSMAPLIREGAAVDLRFDPPGDVRAGDLILFARAERLVLHRVMAVEHGHDILYFTEKGDHQPFSGLITSAEYLARVTGVRARGRFVCLRSRRGRMLNRSLFAVSRIEMALYGWKVNRMGERPGVTGRFVSRLFGFLRRVILSVLSGSRLG